MLLEAIFGIIAISVVFCCCTFCCYLVFQFIFSEEKPEISTEPDPWEAKHYYDPLPLSTPSPPDTIFKPTPYTFKLQNGNGVYSTGLPQAVINPAVLQYPPGHVLEQQRVPISQSQPPAQSRKEKDRNKTNRRPSRSRSPSPSPRTKKNVWSTETEFQNPQNYYYHHHYPPNNPYQQQQQYQRQPQQYQQEFQRQYVQLTQEHYPIQKHIQFQKDEYFREKQQRGQDNDNLHHHHHHHHQQHHHKQQEEQQQQIQYDAFMASSHATNVYTQVQPYEPNPSPNHHRKHSRSHKSKSRHKEEVT